MTRRVFISFLGSSPYKKCKYCSGEFTSSETFFVQEATLEWIDAKSWTDNDICIILLTGGENGSKIKNWDFEGLQDEKYCLKTVLEKMNLPCRIEPLDIPDGKNEKEIWNVFKIIVDQIQDGDELYLDLTHGLRYLPMLLLVLGNYTKFLKNTKVLHISYGNWEGRNEDCAPFVDLLPFSKLQDWTSASKDFIEYGKVKELHCLLEEKYTPLQRDGAELKQINKKLIEFSKNITYNDLEQIEKGADIQNQINMLRNKNEIIPEPFFPLLEKIEEKTHDFKQNDLGNVFAATKWCIRHELYQNAYSILLEGLISIVLTAINADIKNENIRKLPTYISEQKSKKVKKENAYKGVNNKEKFDENYFNQIWDFLDDDTAKIIEQLNKYRNTYMHARTGNNNVSIDKLKKIDEFARDLEEWYENISIKETDKSC